MFLCIGENEDTSLSVGRGETLSAAIQNWAYRVEWDQIMNEFDRYNPTIVEGVQLSVTYVLPPPVEPRFTYMPL